MRDDMANREFGESPAAAVATSDAANGDSGAETESGGAWTAEVAIVERRGAWQEIWRRLRQDRFAMAGLVVICALTAIAIFAPWIAPHDPTTQFRDGLRIDGLPVGPSSKFLLGTDSLGRDLLSRLIYGSRISLLVAVVARALTLIPAVVLGLVAGFAGGKTETLIMRFTDVMMAFPIYLLAMALVVVLKPGLTTLIGVIVLIFWTSLARVLHGEVLSIKESQFVTAARLGGCSNARILFRHILPHMAAPIIVYTTLGLGNIILFEAAMSYIGLGIQPPTPSWGNMIAAGQKFYMAAPLLVVVPGVVMMATVLAFNLVGDGLRDAFDPLQRRVR